MIKDDLQLAGSGGQADPKQQVRLIDLLGKQLGVMTLSQAEAIAMNEQLKLRCIASSANATCLPFISGQRKSKGAREAMEHVMKLWPNTALEPTATVH